MRLINRWHHNWQAAGACDAVDVLGGDSEMPLIILTVHRKADFWQFFHGLWCLIVLNGVCL